MGLYIFIEICITTTTIFTTIIVVMRVAMVSLMLIDLIKDL